MFDSIGNGPKGRLAGAAALAFMTVALGGQAAAQQAASPRSANGNADDGGTLAEVIVTGSRIRGEGFETPTPVSTVTAEALEQRASTNIADFLNELPSFRPTATPTASGLSVFLSGANVLDLRGLGTERTLVLFNGRRQVPTVLQGVDLNTVPSIAIGRIDVVTGGASAAYGSDAVAGVVNVIYDSSFEGLKLEAQTGISAEGDAGDDRLAFAFGSPVLDNRGHILVAGEWQRRSKGVDQRDRDWANDGWGRIPNPANTGPADGIPAILTRPDRRLSIATDGGLILGPGPLAFREFAPDGTLRAFQRGTSAGSTWMQGGSGSDFTPDVTIFTPFERRNLLATFDYTLTPGVKLFIEGGYSMSESNNDSVVQPFSLGNLTIRRDNAFLHPSVTSVMDANGIAAFTLSRVHTDFGFVGAENVYRTDRFAAGFTGDFLDERMTWTLTYQRGESRWGSQSPRNLLTANFAKAVDSIINPATGRPACRSAVAGTDPSCVPINLFGVGAPSAAALKYIQGTSVIDQLITQELAAAEINGSLFDNWAGPVGVAVGIEHREDRLRLVSDDLSNASAYLFVNAKSLSGEVSVKEAFAETVFPLLSSESALGQLELNGAVRYTDYSTVGDVTTWKGGLVWRPATTLMLRGSVSRDIRAPNINELFLAAATPFFSPRDPCDVSRINQNPNFAANCLKAGLAPGFRQTVALIPNITGGNRDLAAERGKTTTAGLVYTPDWATGLSVAVDWFKITVDDAITTLSAQFILDECYANATFPNSFCPRVTRRSDGQLVQTQGTFVNVAKSRNEGLDWQARYRFGDSWSLGLNGTYLWDRTLSTDGKTFVNRAGEVVASAGNNGSPKLRATASLGHDWGPLSGFVQLRYVGKGRADVTLDDIEGLERNRIDAQWYVDLSGRYAFELGGRQLQFFAGVNNVLDRDPPIVPIDFISAFQTSPIFYDVIGRYYFGGLRANF